MEPLNGTALEEYVIQLRRDFHRNPELGGEEERTSAIVQQELAKLEIPSEAGFAKTGVLGVIEGESPGPTVALRADMDALPIHERAKHDYISVVPGKMHACGHDAHTAMLLGAAHYIMGRRKELNGRVLLVFQPAEEVSPIGGAQPMMEQGVFDKYVPDVMFAQHVWPKLPVGQFGVKPGYVMGASDKFQITITGSGGHASMPHQSVDVIMAVNQVISGIQTIVSRNVDPLKQAVVTIGLVQSGYRYNVIADTAYLEGTVRTFDPAVRAQIEKRLGEIVAYSCQAMGAKSELTYTRGYPCTVNDENTAAFVKRTIIGLHGSESCPDIEPSLAGEDFARFLEKYKGVYYWLGVGGDKGDFPALHDPAFDLDERALKIGYTTMGNVALAYCQRVAQALPPIR
ncbi:M20 family metallopeptidase [Brevibacillus sp. B_LB10_24]|uniref:M20 metallopeptidase family protein n=1 Tax=Brevibacillus sp. B_LB10_24 TaxID=3380645 RepID=UPI0038BA4A77